MHISNLIIYYCIKKFTSLYKKKGLTIYIQIQINDDHHQYVVDAAAAVIKSLKGKNSNN